MIKKKLVFIFLPILLFSLVIAQNNDSNNTNTNPQPTGTVIDQAYQCLENQIDSKDQSALSLQEAVFGVLALGGDSKLLGAIEDKKSGSSWSESSSTIKDTSQVLLAYDRINRNTDDIESWILSNEITALDLTWNLQIDIPSLQESTCTISYANEQKTIMVHEDQTLSGNTGTCLSITPSGYWLRVNNNCIGENFTTVCDQNFVTALSYQRGSSSTIFISPTTHSAAPLGSTIEKINSRCFSETASCDYEGTLWAALALDSAGLSVSKYLPYLQALSDSNVRFLPSSFLHKIISGSNQYSTLVGLQQQDKYWLAPNSPNLRFYDSALAMLSLQGTGSSEFTNSQAYFESIVTPEGCWNSNNIRDTAFLLYGGWPRSVSSSGPGTTPPTSQTCISQGFTCTSSLFTCTDIGGTVLNYECLTGTCCSETPELQSCSEQSGTICPSGKTCSGTKAQSTEGSCCLGTCEDIPQENECQTQGGKCYSSCNEDETQESYSCDGSEVCCTTKSSTSEGGLSLTIWIIIIAILILGGIIAFIMIKRKRDLSPKKGKFPSPTTRGMPPGRRPPFPPGRGPVPLQGARRIPQRQMPTSPRQTSSKTDKELEETMKKLKEMGS